MESVDRQSCEELAVDPGSEFSLALRFMPRAEADRQLALEALFRSLRDIPFSVSDPSVGLAKLGWWQSEIAAADTAGSQHPVVRALMATNLLGRLQDSRFSNYLHAVMLGLEEETLANRDELNQRISTVAKIETQIVVGESFKEDLGGSWHAVTSAARLLELTRTLSRASSVHQWLPMDLLAQTGFSKAGNSGEVESQALVAALAEMALDCLQDASLPTGSVPRGAEYLLVKRHLTRRRLQRAQKNPAAFLRGEQLNSAGDVFATWRISRRVYQQAFLEEVTDD